MHYPPYAFAVDTSKPTIIVPAGKTITQPDFMSDVSIKYIVFRKESDYVTNSLIF